MTELELLHLRRDKWRVDGDPIRTLEQAREFIDSMGMALMYPVRPMPLLPTFLGATIGSDQNLPLRQMAFSDPRAQAAEELLLRLVRNKFAFEAQLYGETLVLSPEVFPYFYALASDRKPKSPLQARSHGNASPLSEHLFRKLEASKSPMSRAQLQEALGGGLSDTAVESALQELWSGLKIARVDVLPDSGVQWDLLYRWAPDLVNQGVRTSDPEAISALVSKYLDCVIAASQDDVERFFSPIASRARIGEVIRALLAAREFEVLTGEERTLLTVASTVEPAAARSAVPPDRSAAIPRRRRNG